MPRPKKLKLTTEEKNNIATIIKKCKHDFFTFIKYVSIYMHQEGGYISFNKIIYDKQKEIINHILENKYVIILKSRQIGISTLTQVFCAWLLLFNQNFNIGIVSRKGSEATNFSKKVREIIDSFPPILTFNSDPNERYIKKTEQSFQLKNGSTCTAEAVSLSDPNKVFRGRTLHLIIFDEAAFISKVKDVFTSVAPATFKAHKELEEKRIPYGIIIISTPNGVVGRGQWFYEQWTKATKEEIKFLPIEIHYSQVPFATPEWIRELKKVMNDDYQWQQEMELRFIVPKESLMGELAVKIQDFAIEPCNVELISFTYGDEEYNLRYKKWFNSDSLNKISHIFIGIDVASAFNENAEKSSSTSIEIFSLDIDKRFFQIGEIVGKIPIIKLKEIIKNLWYYFKLKENKNIKIIIENNSYAQNLCEYLGEELPYEDLFWEDKKKIPGLTTTNKTKPVIIESIYWVINEYKYAIKSKILLNDLIGLQKLKHTPDTVMALGMISYYLYKNRDNIFNQSLPFNTIFHDIYKERNDHNNLHNILKELEYSNFIETRNNNNINDTAGILLNLFTTENKN